MKGRSLFLKNFIKAACVAFILTVVYTMIPFQAACSDITDDVFRMHILANSDSEEDQNLKLKVRDRLLECSQTLFEQAKSKEEAEKVVADHLQELADAATAEIAENGYNYAVQAEITRMYFTTRHYENYTLPSGMYDALRITIGEGKGHNWWCVMFPSLCINTSADGDRKIKETLGDEEYDLVKNEQHEYKFFIVEFFEKIRSSFF